MKLKNLSLALLSQATNSEDCKVCPSKDENTLILGEVIKKLRDVQQERYQLQDIKYEIISIKYQVLYNQCQISFIRYQV